MKSRRTQFGIVLTLASLLVAGLIVLNGCKKSEPTTPTEPNEVAGETEAEARRRHFARINRQELAEDINTALLLDKPSKLTDKRIPTCPIMGKPINKDIFTEYKGKKVYFCCAGCKEEFEKEPEKYIAKLPQFKE